MRTASWMRPGCRVSRLAAAFAVAGLAYALPAAAAREDTWAGLPPIPTPRRLLAAAALDGAIYTFGGCGSPCFDPPLHTSTYEETRVEVYADGAWSPRDPAPVILFGAAAAAVGDRIYLLGGYVTGNSVYEYDPGTEPDKDSWARKASMPTPRHGLAAAVLDGEVYVAGGSNGSAPSNALEVYDPAGNSWKQLAPMPTPRVFLAAAALDHKIYAIGGSPDCCGNGRTDAVEIYDPARDSWSSGPPLPVALQVSAAVAANGKIYVLGGFIPGSGVQGSTFEYDPVAKTWTRRTDMPDPRDQAPAVVLLEKDGDDTVETPHVHVLGGSVDCHCKARGTHSSYKPAKPTTPPPPPLSLRKVSVPGNPVAPGGTVHFTLTVTNPGAAAVSGARVTDDPAAAGLLAPLWCKGKGCTPSHPGKLDDTLEVPRNAEVSYEITGKAPCACGRTRIENIAYLQAPGQDKLQARATVPIVPAPPGDLALTVSGPVDLIDYSGLAYTFTVANPGKGTACGTTLQVEPPPGSTLLSASAPCAAGLPCQLGDLAPGASVPVTAKLSLPAGLQCPAVLATKVSVTSCDSETKTFKTQAPCLLSITKTDGRDKAAPGDPILYTIAIENEGCAAIAGAAVTDPLPPALLDTQWCKGPDCPLPSLPPLSQPGPLVDTLSLPAGGREIYRAFGTVAPQFSGPLVNTVTITPPGSSPVSTTDVTLIEAPPPEGGITATCTQIYGAPFENGMITKTFVIENHGPSAQGDNPGPELVDTLPAGLTLVGATASSGAITTAANTVDWNGSIPAHGSVIVEVTATVDAGTLGTKICNGGTIFFDSDGDGVNESNRPLVPCCFLVRPPLPVPGLSTSGLVVLALLLSALALTRLRHRAGQ